ncbi:hypothetical protein COO60DRAFT_1180198 [Scenedesmus sp. NREL 46B-D3]|nr:hypothetical protein COO60DRAFT_1180198 [Scenedesmus sp. NREL 46B-D3]
MYVCACWNGSTMCSLPQVLQVLHAHIQWHVQWLTAGKALSAMDMQSVQLCLRQSRLSDAVGGLFCVALGPSVWAAPLWSMASSWELAGMGLWEGTGSDCKGALLEGLELGHMLYVDPNVRCMSDIVPAFAPPRCHHTYVALVRTLPNTHAAVFQPLCSGCRLLVRLCTPRLTVSVFQCWVCFVVRMASVLYRRCLIMCTATQVYH